MLRRIENVKVFYKRDLWGTMVGEYTILLEVGRKGHLSPSRVSVQELRDMAARSTSRPVHYLTVGDRSYWRYQDRWHADNDGLDADEVLAMLVTREMRQADRLHRATAIAEQGQLPVPGQRRGLSADVEQLVWNRDGGACRACGSTTDPQFDHVIPVARGGGGTEANLQVLCGPCNRRKGARIV